MQNTNHQLIHQFYSAFQHKDYVTMQSLYHSEATFSDPVFPNLSSSEVKAMWEMLVTSGKDLKVSFDKINATEAAGSCRWEAWYTFSRTGKKVHNVIHASFEFRDGKIFRHTDTFDIWKWSRQALGLSGILLGWSPLVRDKVRDTARRSLDKFIKRADA